VTWKGDDHHHHLIKGSDLTIILHPTEVEKGEEIGGTEGITEIIIKVVVEGMKDQSSPNQTAGIKIQLIIIFKMFL
jgi:hypothetical protein